MSASSVAEALEEVRLRIENACARAGRDPGSARLVAVSKRHPAARVREAFEAGQRLFGENYVQELLEKAEALRELEALRWHFIGHLQTNKAKLVARLGATVETVDAPRLAEELSKRASSEGRVLPVLLQVNVGGEAQKSGCEPSELPALIEACRGLAGLDVRGLMTVPPFDPDPEKSRPCFARLAELASRHGLAELSMGMSADLEVAVEEGATIVRVGTAIFGERPG